MIIMFVGHIVDRFSLRWTAGRQEQHQPQVYAGANEWDNLSATATDGPAFQPKQLRPTDTLEHWKRFQFCR